MRILQTAVAIAALTLGTLDRPHISGITPPAPSKSDRAQTLAVNGTGFAPGLTLEVTTPAGATQTFTGSALQQMRDTSFQVSIVLGIAGTYSMVVRNTDGGVSDPFQLKVQPTATSKVVIEKIAPENITKNAQPQTLTITGRGFEPGLSVSVTDPTGVVAVIKGSPVGTVSPTSFEFSVVIDKGGEYSLMVTNPSGENSNSMPFTASTRK
jgi:hypothetical protein